MAIPQNIDNVLDKNFKWSLSPDNTEIEAWLTWLPPAVQKAYTVYAECKQDADVAESNFEFVKATLWVKLGSGGEKVTSTRGMIPAQPEYVEADKNKNQKKAELRFAEAVLEGVKERSGSIRKIATMRANTQTYSESGSGYAPRVANNNQLPPQQQQSNFGGQQQDVPMHQGFGNPQQSPPVQQPVNSFAPPENQPQSNFSQ